MTTPNHSNMHVSALQEKKDSARLRHVLQADLRAMGIPSHASLPTDSIPTTGAQRQRGRLGDYLYTHGLISEAALAAALAEQQQRIAEERPIALGDLLV